MVKYNDTDGVWRTVGGRRIFIKNGQNLASAMKESGKFKKSKTEVKDEQKKFEESDFESNDKLSKEFWEKYAKIQDEKQFNKKVELNNELNKWKKENGIELEGNFNEYKLYKDGKQISYLAVDEDISKEIKRGKYLTNEQVQAYKKLDKSKANEVAKGLKDKEFHFAGEELYSDDPNRFGDTLRKHNEKMNPSKSRDDVVKQLDDDYDDIDKKYPELSKKVTENYNKSIEQASKELGYNKNTSDGKEFMEIQNKAREIREKQFADSIYEKQNNTSNSTNMSEKEWSDKIKEIQNRPSYKEKMNKAVEELNEKYGYSNNGAKDENNEKGFVQHTDMYGGTYEYTPQRLKEMAEHGTKPMEHSYTGGGWEGTKYDSNLSTKEIAKNISDYSKKEFPDVKLSRKTDYNGIDIHVMNSDKDMFITNSDIDKMNFSDLEQVTRSNQFNWWAKDNVSGYNENKSYSIDDVRNYAKESLKTTKNHENNVSGNEWYLSDYGKKVISGLNKEMNSYNYDDSDGMVDYFNTNFYGYVHIGKWDKPYQTTGNSVTSALKQKAYQKYLKEHPSSKMTFNQFKKMEEE